MESPKKSSVAARIEAFVAARQLTLYRLAMDAGIKPNTITAVVRNDSDIKASTLTAIKEAHPELSLDWLLTGKGEMLVRGGGTGGGSRAGGGVKSAVDDLLTSP